MQKKRSDNLRKEIGKKIASARKNRGVTQVQVADELGMTQGMITQIESGSRMISVVRLIQICRLLNISADYVLGLEGVKNKDSSSVCEGVVHSSNV